MTNNHQPNLNREMFYDQLTKTLGIIIRGAKSQGIDAKRRECQLEVLKDEAKVFYIDSMTLDSLLNQPYSLKEFNPDTLHLPFPHIFFEFESGLRSRNLEGNVEENFWVNGLLYSELNTSAWLKFLNKKVGSNIQGTGFSVSSFGNGYVSDGQTSQIMPLGPFDTLNFIKEDQSFLIEKQNLNSNNSNNIYKFDLKSQKLWGFNEEDNPLIPLDYKQIDDDNLDVFKMSNLVVNLIEHINAENVEIIPRERTMKIRQARERREIQLKPYYLLEVKKEVYHPSEEEQTGLWSLDYRVWVRGHYQHYHTKDKIIRKYLIPHIKGPVDAPWKNNRYMMLYKNFRHRLDRRGDEDIGTCLDDKIK